MIPQKVVPTMSTDGWVSGVKQRIDKLFAYWLANEKDQSMLAWNNIVSFQYDIQQYGNSPEELAARAGENLENYLSAHFDQVTVVGLVKHPPDLSGGLYHVEFDVKIVEKGIGYNVGRTLLEIKDGSFRKIIEGL